MKSSVVENLPQPVVILKEIDDTGKIVDKGKVALGPKEDPKNYGNLLKDLSNFFVVTWEVIWNILAHSLITAKPMMQT